MNDLNKNEVFQALEERLGTELRPGDKIIIEKVEDGFHVYSEFKEIRSEQLKLEIGR